MSPEEPSAREAALEAAMADYLARVDAGERIDQTDLLAKYGDLAKELADFIAADRSFGLLLDDLTLRSPELEIQPAESRADPVLLNQNALNQGALNQGARPNVRPGGMGGPWAAVGVAGVLLAAAWAAVTMTPPPITPSQMKASQVVTEESHARTKGFVDPSVVWDGRTLPRTRPTVATRLGRLIGRWEFVSEPAADGVIVDQSGLGHHGRLQGGPRWLSDAKALDFDGVDDCVLLGNPPQLDFEGEITLVAWLRLASTDGFRNVVAHGYLRSPDEMVYFHVMNGTLQAGSWNGPTHVASLPVRPEDMHVWLHLVATHEAGAWHMYRDGELVAKTVDPVGSIRVADDWAIGSTGNGRERFFHGQIREIAIYDRALNAAEVRVLWQQCQARVPK